MHIRLSSSDRGGGVQCIYGYRRRIEGGVHCIYGYRRRIEGGSSAYTAIVSKDDLKSSIFRVSGGVE